MHPDLEVNEPNDIKWALVTKGVYCLFPPSSPSSLSSSFPAPFLPSFLLSFPLIFTKFIEHTLCSSHLYAIFSSTTCFYNTKEHIHN